MPSCCSAPPHPLTLPRGELRVSSSVASSGMSSLPCLAGFRALLCLRWHGTNLPLTTRSPVTLEKQVQHRRAYWTLGALPGAAWALRILILRTTWRAGANSILQMWKLRLKELKTAVQSFFYPSKKISIFETRGFYAQPPTCGAGTLMTLWRKTPKIPTWDQQPLQV